ncbi:MAG TPA: DUF6452 family protein [Cyclobacteriaceae bacterium]
MKRVVWFALFLVIGVSCLDQPDCFRQDLNLIGISFRKMYDGNADTVALLNVSASATDSIFYEKVYGTTFSLPLNYLSTTTTFAIEQLVRDYLDGIAQYDTMVLKHSSKAQFVSEDCGERFVVSNLELLRSTYDSIQVVSSSPGNPAHINIKIYRCPRTNILRMSFRQLYMDKTDTLSKGKLDSRPITTIVNTDAAVTWLQDTTMSAVLLPLNPNATSTAYKFNFDNGDENTLTLNYDTEPVQIISKCPVQNVYHNLKAVSNFKILTVSKDSLQDPPATNIETFRCPTTNQIKVNFKQIKGSSKITDTLHIVTLKADYLGDSLIYSATDTSAVALPLNPDATTTKYTFEVTGETTSTLTLQSTYKTTTYQFHKVCGVQTIFSDLAIDATNTSFYSANMLTLLTDVRYPSVINIEITRK